MPSLQGPQTPKKPPTTATPATVKGLAALAEQRLLAALDKDVDGLLASVAHVPVIRARLEQNKLAVAAWLRLQFSKHAKDKSAAINNIIY
jgi:hypothetical protein